MDNSQSASQRTPWHLWLVGAILLFWYLSGAITIMMGQHASLPGLSPDEAAYYAAKPVWQELVTDLGLVATVAGSLALLLRRAWTVQAFALAAVVILLIDIYDLTNGTSRVYANNVAAVVTAIILVGVVLNWLYARAMQRRGVLR